MQTICFFILERNSSEDAKFYMDTRKKVVEVQVDGALVIGHEEQSSAIDQPQPVSPGRTDHPVRIWVELRISNGLHLSQKI